ncbi:MAG: hypothetical protein L0216_03725 [Planctomycetales bacterium]|nr:hypothetical protein [Planctomycetales bacterium]
MFPSCDLCRAEILPGRDIRYEVSIRVRAHCDPGPPPGPGTEFAEPASPEEIQGALDLIGSLDVGEILERLQRTLRVSLCAACHGAYLQAPHSGSRARPAARLD